MGRANCFALRLTGYVLSLIVLGLFYAGFGAVEANAQSAVQDPDVFGTAMKSFLIAHQDALNSGDPDRILKSSIPVAVASLALLNSLDVREQQSRKTLGALPYAQALLSDLPTELLLLRMELNLGETPHAAELKKHILSTNPDNAALHVALAEILEQRSEFADAIREAQRGLELDPTLRDAQIALGMAYWGLNAFQYNEETLHAFTAAHQLDPESFSSNLLLGSIESQYHRFDVAALHLRAAIAADSSSPEPWYQLGMNAYEQSRYEEATELFDHYLSLVQAGGNGKLPQIRLALLTLDQIAEEQGKTPDVAHRAQEEELKQQILQANRTTNANSSTTTPAMGSPDTSDRAPVPEKADAASTTTASVTELRGLAANALANIGTVLARRQDYAGAIVPFRYALEEDPSQESVKRNLGLVACIIGSYEEGLQALKQVVAAHGDDAVARGYLGVAEFETGNYSDAATTFAALGPGLGSMPLFQATAAAAFARTGDRGRAEQALVDLKSADSDPQVQARAAVAYLDLGDVDRAADLAKATLSAGTQTPAEALRVLGLLDLERGDASKAVAEFEDEAKADHQSAEDQLESQALLIEALIESGKKSEGEDLRLKVVRANPNLANSLLQQGNILLRNGNAHAAYEKFAAAHTLAPHDKDIRTAFESASRTLHIPTH